jgi:hypothetical protein
MDHSKDTNLQLAVQEADKLAKEIEEAGGNISPAFSSLEKGIKEFEASGYPIEALLPGEAGGPGIGAAELRSGKKFWEIFSKQARDKLCKEDGDLWKLVKSGASASPAAIIHAITTNYPEYLKALFIVAAIAAMIAKIGIEKWCKYGDKKSAL